MSATKNINAEKIQGSLTADTINIQTLGSGTSVTNLGIDSSGNVVTGTTGGGGDNFYVTGFTYNDANTFTISQNGGLGDLTSTINNVTGLTVNGTLVVDTISATTINGSVTGLTLNDLDDVTTNIPATPDNTYQGELVYFDVTTNQWVSGSEYGTLGTVTIWGKKGSVGTIDKGLPVYIVGFDDDIHEVELANATTATTMPVIGFTAEDFDNAGVYPIITFGKITGLDTTSGTTTLNPNGETWAVNDVLYMSTTTGGLTKFRPSGTNTQIQRIAKVLKVDATGGQLFIFNTARTAGLPNLTTDYLWVGDGDDTPQEVIRTDVGITTTGFTYNDNNTFTITDDNGGSFSSTINQMSGLTINGDLDVTGDSTLNTLTATSITSNSAIDVFNGHINLRDNSYFLQGRTVADTNVSLIGVDNQDRVFVGNAGYDTYIDSDTIVDGHVAINGTPESVKLLIQIDSNIERAFRIRNTDNSSQFNMWPTTAGTGTNIFRFDNDNTGITALVLGDDGSVAAGIPNGTEPLAKFHVHSTIAGKPLVLIEDETQPDSTPFIITEDGDVGIGTDTPQELLHVSGNVRSDGQIIIGELGTGTSITNLGIDTNGTIVSGTTGETNTASNLGGGTGLFAQKNGVDLEFKSLTSTGDTITISNDSTTVNVEVKNKVNDASQVFSWFMNVT